MKYDKYHAMNARIGSIKDLNKPDDFIYEPKMDGIRALCHTNSDIKLISRNNINLTPKYPELDFRKNIKAKTCVLDGEIVAYNKKGNPEFNLLQLGHAAHYVVFDILSKDGKDLTHLPLSERKVILDKTVIDGSNIEKIFFTHDGKALWRIALKKKLEGVMAKEFSAQYYSGLRSSVWLKIKSFNTLDCIIIGYTSGKRIISSLALGIYDSQKNLKYIGKVGTGFSFEFLDKLYSKLTKLRVKKSPLEYEIKEKDINWVSPKLVCEVKYVEITRDVKLRSPVFLRLRTDKTPAECILSDQI